MTADLGERLAEAIEAAAAPVTVEEAIVRGRRQQRRRRAILAAVVVGAVGIAGVAFAATQPSQQRRLNVSAPTTHPRAVQGVAPRCTTADLRRPWPPIPQPVRITTRYVLDEQTHVDPAPEVRPRISAERAWLAAKDAMNNPITYPPAGGTGTILFGSVSSTTAVPSYVHRLAWVIILHNTAGNALKSRSERVSPPPNPPCYFGHAYAVIDANTGKSIFWGGQYGVQGDTLPSTITTPAPSSSPTTGARYAPCKARQITALAPEWASPYSQQTDDQLTFTNTGDACTISGHPALVASAPDQADVAGQPGNFGTLTDDGPIVLAHGSTAQLVVAANHACTATHRYTTLTIAMPGGGSVVVTLPTQNASPDPNQNGRDLTLGIGPSCPPYVGAFHHG
jgi:hypothetical protein